MVTAPRSDAAAIARATAAVPWENSATCAGTNINGNMVTQHQAHTCSSCSASATFCDDNACAAVQMSGHASASTELLVNSKVTDLKLAHWTIPEDSIATSNSSTELSLRCWADVNAIMPCMYQTHITKVLYILTEQSLL